VRHFQRVRADVIPAFVNSRAGNAAAARAALEAAGGFEIRELEPSTLAPQVRDVIRGGARRILIAGGDGSIASAANALAGEHVELALLPCGTLNHLAKDLSLPLDLELAARAAVDGVAVPVDAAVVNDRIFLNTSSVGAYVSFVAAREPLEHRLGYHVASVVAAAKLLVRMPTFRVSLKVLGVARDYLTPLVFIGVGERELKLPALGARIPKGRPGLHVMVVRRRSGARTLATALAAAARGVRAVAKTPAMDAFVVEACTITCRTHRIAVDGEIVTEVPPLQFRHVPGHLHIVVPRSTEQ
jgi:diacylglycerol kinase family enzyme